MISAVLGEWGGTDSPVTWSHPGLLKPVMIGQSYAHEVTAYLNTEVSLSSYLNAGCDPSQCGNFFT